MMSHHNHLLPVAPVSRRRMSSVEETRHTALETIKLTWIQLDHLLEPLGSAVVILDDRAVLPEVHQIVRDLQNPEIVAKINSFFEKIITSLAAAVARIQLYQGTDTDREEIVTSLDGFVNVQSPNSNQVIMMEDDVLEYVISENLLLKTLGYATHPHCPEGASLVLRWNLLRILETLVSSCLKDARLLSHESILVPLLGLFDACTGNRHADTDRKMMGVMNELTYCLKVAPDLLQFFVEEDNATVEPSTRVIRDLRILSYLYPHIHNPNETGQLARSAVLAVLRIVQRDDVISQHIAEKSCFCPVLISGFSAFYYTLPQKCFTMFGPGWHRITMYDVTCSVDLQHFTEYVEFCNAAMQLSHPFLQASIIKSFREQFLIPVVTSALTQSGPDELIASMAYFDYVMRTLQDSKLRAAVLDFLMMTPVEDRFIVDHLIGHILHANTRVGSADCSKDFRCSVEAESRQCLTDLVDVCASRVSAVSQASALNFSFICSPKLPPYSGYCEHCWAWRALYSCIHDRVLKRAAGGPFPHPEWTSDFWRCGSSLAVEELRSIVVSTVSVALFHTLLDINYQPLLDYLLLRYLGRSRSLLAEEAVVDSVWDNLDVAEELLALSPECCEQLGFALDQTAVAEVPASPSVFRKFFGKNQPEKTVLPERSSSPVLTLPLYTTYLLNARCNLARCVKSFSNYQVNGSAGSATESPVGTAGLRRATSLFPDLELHGSNFRGPFLASLLYKMDHFLEHDIYFCLQLTGLISRILLFPHEQIWSHLVRRQDDAEIFGRTFLQILASLKETIDSTFRMRPTIGKTVLERTYKSLMLRTLRADSPTSETPLSVAPQSERSRKFGGSVRGTPKTVDGMLVERIFASGDPLLETVEMSAAPKFSRKNSAPGGPDAIAFRIAAYAAVLLNEFVQETAAICQERALISMMSVYE